MSFVTIEGLDGAGKDTALEAIEESWPEVVITSEPSDLDTGKMVRSRLSDEDSNPVEDFYLFMADRVHHIEKRVRPADEEGKLVVSGRYADSTRVYQPVALVEAGVFDSTWHAKDFIESTMKPWNYVPDRTLYLDISVETALKRASGEEKYEKREFLEKVHDNYRALVDANPERFVVIDAEKPEDVVRRRVVEEVNEVIDPVAMNEGW